MGTWRAGVGCHTDLPRTLEAARGLLPKSYGEVIRIPKSACGTTWPQALPTGWPGLCARPRALPHGQLPATPKRAARRWLAAARKRQPGSLLHDN